MIEKKVSINTIIDLKTLHYGKLTQKIAIFDSLVTFGHFLDVYEKI